MFALGIKCRLIIHLEKPVYIYTKGQVDRQKDRKMYRQIVRQTDKHLTDTFLLRESQPGNKNKGKGNGTGLA